MLKFKHVLASCATRALKDEAAVMSGKTGPINLCVCSGNVCSHEANDDVDVVSVATAAGCPEPIPWRNGLYYAHIPGGRDGSILQII